MSKRAVAPAPAAQPDIRDVEQFLFREARLLDERRFEEWRELFTEDGVYWKPSQHEQASPDQVVSIFYDDRAMMAARITRLRHPEIHVQTPISHTAHMVSNVELDASPEASGDIVAHAVFFMAEYRMEQPRWYGGRYDYRLCRVGGGFRIRMKKVVLVNCTAALSAMAIYV